MKRYTFLTTYRGEPSVALQLLLKPESFYQKMPFVRKIEVLSHPSPESILSSWEVEVDGALFTWREEVHLLPDHRTVQFRMVRGDFKSYSGTWSVSPEGEQTTLTLQIELDWGAAKLSEFVSGIFEQKAERAFRGMVLALGRIARQKTLERSRAFRRFGFIFHPLDLNLLAEGFGDEDLKARRPELLEKILTWFPPFRRGIITGIRSLVGTEVEGDMILLPLLPKQMLGMADQVVLDRLVDACRLSERYGDQIVGLGAYAANVGRKGTYLAKQVRIPVTTGSSYTIAIAIEATLKACESIALDIGNATVAVIGATGTIGHVCSIEMSHKARHLILAGRNLQRLEDLSDSLSDKSRATISTLVDLDAAISNADVIIAATNTPVAIIGLTRVKKGAIICDISRPRNVSEANVLLRPDVLVIDGGVVRPPGKMSLSFSFGLAQSLVYACMAETMILALEGRYESYSLGGNVDLARVQEIAELGRKHGFSLAGLRSFEKEVSEQQLERIREARSRSLPRKRTTPSSPLKPR